MNISEKELKKIEYALKNKSAYKLFSQEIGFPEENTDNEGFALMWNLDNSKLFLLPYAKPSNSWAKTAESQNPWIHLGYISGIDCIDGDPFGYILGLLNEKNKQL